MSETTQSQPQYPAPDDADILVNLILTCLAPMFLTTVGGNINHARIAAAHTLDSYRAETRFDLIAIAQIIAFGLAALGSLQGNRISEERQEAGEIGLVPSGPLEFAA